MSFNTRKGQLIEICCGGVSSLESAIVNSLISRLWHREGLYRSYCQDVPVSEDDTKVFGVRVRVVISLDPLQLPAVIVSV